MRHLSAIVLIGLLIALPSCKFLKDKGIFGIGKKEKALAILLARQDSIRVTDSIKRVQEHLMAIENARLDSIRIAEEARLALENKYNIIVGSFLTPEYATGLAEVYKTKGFNNTTIIKMEGGRFDLVSAEAHDNLKSASRRMMELRESVESEAWIYIKK